MYQGREGTLLSRYGIAPDQIEASSFDVIGKIIPAAQYSTDELQIVKRIVHSTGDPEILRHLRLHPQAIASGVEAIRTGRPIYTDVRMVASGINKQLAARFGCQVVYLTDAPGIAEDARRQAITRAAAAVRRSGAQLGGAIVAIGNAPTALLELLDTIDSGFAPPALVIGVPVGFIAAAESKAELAGRNLPFVTIDGTRGGSTVAVAIVNALLRLAVAGR